MSPRSRSHPETLTRVMRLAFRNVAIPCLIVAIVCLGFPAVYSNFQSWMGPRSSEPNPHLNLEAFFWTSYWTIFLLVPVVTTIQRLAMPRDDRRSQQDTKVRSLKAMAKAFACWSVRSLVIAGVCVFLAIVALAVDNAFGLF